MLASACFFMALGLFTVGIIRLVKWKRKMEPNKQPRRQTSWWTNTTYDYVWSYRGLLIAAGALMLISIVLIGIDWAILSELMKKSKS